MGKICIVKRRKREVQETVSCISQAQGGLYAADPVTGSLFEQVVRDGDGNLAVELTGAQAELVRSSRHFRRLLGATGEGLSLDVRHGTDGGIIFNFSFKEVHTVKMLSPRDVCTMLQVSRWFLTKLVRKERIRSYKIGRLRRFSVTDVLDYISASRQVEELPVMRVYTQEAGCRG